MDNQDRNAIQAMIRYGGGFESQLGRLALNTDTFCAYLEEMGVLFGIADKENTAKLLALVKEAEWAYHATQADRLTRIKETWPESWARYVKFGKDDERAMDKLLNSESAADLPMGG